MGPSPLTREKPVPALGRRGGGGVKVPGLRLPMSSHFQLQLPAAGSPAGDVPVPGPALEPQRCLCAEPCSSHTCAAAEKQLVGLGPFPSAALGWHHPLFKSTGTPKALSNHLCLLMRAALGISRGSLGCGQGKPRHSWSIHFLPAHVPPLQWPCPPPWAGMPSTLLA